jgi:hypothetical protein
MGSNKKPFSKFHPSSIKEPRISEQIRSLAKGVISWHIRILDKDGPFGWRNAGSNDLWEIAGKLGLFEKLTWPEILNRNNHSIRVSQLCEEAKNRLVELNQEDIDELISLHLDGKKRVWGIRDRNFLKILWWDPKHKVCPSPIKYT